MSTQISDFKQPAVINIGGTANTSYSRTITVESYSEKDISAHSPIIINVNSSQFLPKLNKTEEKDFDEDDFFGEASKIILDEIYKNFEEYNSTFGRYLKPFTGYLTCAIGKLHSDPEIIIVPKDLKEIWIYENENINGLRFISRGKSMRPFNDEVLHLGAYGLVKRIFELEQDEKITGINLVVSSCIRRIQFVTDRRLSPIYGTKSNGKRFKYIIPENLELIGVASRSNDFLESFQIIVYSPEEDAEHNELKDQLLWKIVKHDFGRERGLIKGVTSTIHGADEGSLHVAIVPNKIKEIKIKSGIGVYSLAFYPVDGEPTFENYIGGAWFKEDTYIFTDSEKLLGFQITLDGRYLSSIALVTSRGVSEWYGDRDNGYREVKLMAPEGREIVAVKGNLSSSLVSFGIVTALKECVKDENTKEHEVSDDEIEYEKEEYDDYE